jgi:hypothetical protein
MAKNASVAIMMVFMILIPLHLDTRTATKCGPIRPFSRQQ